MARKQLNIRLTQESLDRLVALAERMSATLHIEVSQSDVVSAALVELEKLYPPARPPKRQ